MKNMKVSVVVNTYNEEKNIKRCLESVKTFADEIIVVDMHSSDRTIEIAKKQGAKTFLHEYTRYVEPARNFALSKATGDWIFLIDADEELPESLIKKLKEIAETDRADFVEIPRKNIIFGKWIEHTRWWPDYLVRFFRNGKVRFSSEIHVPPKCEGEGIKLEAEERNALVHHNFQTISQFIERLNRYTDIQSEEKGSEGYEFKVEDLLLRPSSEFFSRFFAGEGYKDGGHGLVLSVLQAFSEFVVFLKIWEKQGFKDQRIDGMWRTSRKLIGDFFYWQGKTTSNLKEKFLLKIKSKL